jgi:hypothetical protein
MEWRITPRLDKGEQSWDSKQYSYQQFGEKSLDYLWVGLASVEDPSQSRVVAPLELLHIPLCWNVPSLQL